MSDVLQECAKNFSRCTNFNYIFVMGNRKRTQIQISIKCSRDEFTHIVGLDHLKDLSVFNTHNTKSKVSNMDKIMLGNITLQDLQKSRFFDVELKNTYNSKTKKGYTISDRITILQDIENIMNMAYLGDIYKWNKKNSFIKYPNGRGRNSSISADYLLAIPSPNNSDEKIYLFAYQENKGAAKKEPIKLSVFSAFADCIDLTVYQEHTYTILQETRENILTRETEILYIHPAYEKSLSVQSQPQSDNIIKVKFDNPIQKNITVNSSGTIAVDQSDPSFFSSIFERLKQTFFNLFKSQDKPDNTPTEKEPQEENKPIEDNSDTTPPIPKEMAELLEARDNFVQGNISFDEYNQAFKQYLLTLHGEEMWCEAAELFSKQLAECPEDKKRYIFCELNAINDNIKKKFPAPVRRWHSMDEIKEFARQQCQKTQSERAERNTSEKDNVKSSDEYKR